MMKRKLFSTRLIWVVAILFLCSCTAHKKIPYLKEVETLNQEDLKKVAVVSEFKIMPKDVLTITVNTSRPELAANFNLPLIPSVLKSLSQTQLSSGASIQSYVVNKDGYIEYPILGRISVAGLTRTELEQNIKAAIYPIYLKEEPIVNVRFVNFKISVLGEVKNPGVYTTSDDRLNIFDALALAGDLTIYGKRQDVLLLRTSSEGEVLIHRIDLQDKNLLLNNDLFYLQQNDQLLVEANKTRANSSGIGAVESLSLSTGLAAISILISVISIITR